MATSKEIDLQFDDSSDLLNLSSESPGFMNLEMEKGMIEKLNITDDTKRMILEKFYRGRKHPDLKKLSSDRTTYSSVLYELFSKIYKQKLIIKIDEDKHQKRFIAQHIFNNQVLTKGYGNSKKAAKEETSKRSLEIFAPSLLIEVENHQKQLLIKEDIPSQTLQNNLPHQHEWIIKDPITQALVSFYQEYSQEISSLQQQMKENIDGSFDNPQENPTLLLLCQNQTFTKLHSIYELITYQRMPISLTHSL